MKRSLFLGVLFVSLCASLFADYNDFETNPYITAEAREAIRPFLLPENHPARAKLDKIFLRSRASFDDDALEEAGFTIQYKQPRSFIRVVSHASLPNYLLKIVTDVETHEKHHKPAWYWFVNRCIGVKKIHEALRKIDSKYFVAPNKWIYPLPVHPYPSKKSSRHERKIVVLLVDDMKLAPKEANRAAWKKQVTKNHLDELYEIMKEVGGRSYRADNIPQTKKGTFAFIDTEYPDASPGFGDIRRYLSPKRQVYWDKLLGH